MKFIRKAIGTFLRSFRIGWKIQRDPYFIDVKQLTTLELRKEPNRTSILNFLLLETKAEHYLEIGVRNPNDNFDHILCNHKYSVDPHVELSNFFKYILLSVLKHEEIDIIFNNNCLS